MRKNVTTSNGYCKFAGRRVDDLNRDDSVVELIVIDVALIPVLTVSITCYFLP